MVLPEPDTVALAFWLSGCLRLSDPFRFVSKFTVVPPVVCARTTQIILSFDSILTHITRTY
jgi:hypothetical protein